MRYRFVARLVALAIIGGAFVLAASPAPADEQWCQTCIALEDEDGNMWAFCKYGTIGEPSWPGCDDGAGPWEGCAVWGRYCGDGA